MERMFFLIGFHSDINLFHGLIVMHSSLSSSFISFRTPYTWFFSLGVNNTVKLKIQCKIQSET